jgi:hypothetical protein
MRCFYSQNFKTNLFIYESYEFLKIVCQNWVFGHMSFVQVFLDL